jgi:hypothetical protein
MPAPQIVTINVSITSAPIPSTLQSSGAIVSQGATNLAIGTFAWLTQASDLTPLTTGSAAPAPLTSLIWSGGIVLVTTASAITGRSVGDIFTTTIAGVVPTGYNGNYRATVTGTNTFTYSLLTNPGTETAVGTYTVAGQGELQAQVGTFFAQGVNNSVAVLELGPGDQSVGPAALQAWVLANPLTFYSYLVPRGWDSSAGLLALLNAFNANNAMTYFFVTTGINTYTNYSNTMKCGLALVEAPGVPFTENSLAADFQSTLSYAPSGSNLMTPNSYAFMTDVTAYPTVGNGPLLTALEAANVNFISTGSQGGVETDILWQGENLDGNDFSYWYSVDWAQINIKLNLSNAIIVGSNNKVNPLYYNQAGINRLQDNAVSTVQTGIGAGLATGSVVRASLSPVDFQTALNAGDFAGMNVVNAVPFGLYTAANPSAYQQGLYGGLTCVYLPQRGFKSVIFNLNVSNLLTQ